MNFFQIEFLGLSTIKPESTINFNFKSTLDGIGMNFFQIEFLGLTSNLSPCIREVAWPLFCGNKYNTYLKSDHRFQSSAVLVSWLQEMSDIILLRLISSA